MLRVVLIASICFSLLILIISGVAGMGYKPLPLKAVKNSVSIENKDRLTLEVSVKDFAAMAGQTFEDHNRVSNLELTFAIYSGFSTLIFASLLISLNKSKQA